MTYRTQVLPLACSLFLGLAIVLAGCGPGDDGEDSPVSGADTAVDAGQPDIPPSTNMSGDAGMPEETDTSIETDTGESCDPKTCEELDRECGSAPDGCGSTILCGTCGGDEKCSVEGQCIRECALVSGEYTAELETTDVTLDVTLDGEPLDESNTGEDDRGRIALHDAESGERAFSRQVWNEGEINVPTTTRLLPGEYVVRYTNTEFAGDGEWPGNEGVKLETVIVSGDEQELTVDVPVTRLRVNALLNGDRVYSGNTGPNDYGRIQIRDPETGDIPYWVDTWYDGEVNIPGATRVVPGRYEVGYELQNGEADNALWPTNANASTTTVLDTVEVDGENDEVLVDIRSVEVEIDATIDGEEVTASNTGPDDHGRIELHPADKGSWAYWTTAWYDGDVSLPSSTRLIPGEYEVRYRNEAYAPESGNWPVTRDQGVLLATKTVDSETDRIEVDVPTAEVTIDPTLNGEAISTSNTGEGSYGRIDLLREGETFVYGAEAWKNGGVNLPVTRRVVPGDYEVRYFQMEYTDFGRWPLNHQFLLETTTLSGTDNRIDVDIPTTKVTVDATIDGEPISSSNTSNVDRGRIELHDPEAGDLTYWSQAWKDGEKVLPVTLTVIPGDYELRYQNVEYRLMGGAWPADTSANLDDVTVEGDSQNVEVDVPVHEFTLDARIDGEAISASNTSPDDRGEFQLRGADGSGPLVTLEAWANGPNLPQNLRVASSDYELFYQMTDYSREGAWPVNESTRVRCLDRLEE